MWRADKNIDEASMRVSRQAFTTGYAAMPAQQGSYRAPVNRRSAYADDRPRSSSPAGGNSYGRGISVGRGRDGLSQAGRADDPKNRYGSKSPFGKRGVCYPYTRGTCPMTAADCKHSRDIYLYSQAEEVLKKAGYCFEHFRYGSCRNDKCKMLHEAIPNSIREAFETVEIEQKETRPSSPHRAKFSLGAGRNPQASEDSQVYAAMPVVRQRDDGAESTHRGILVTTTGRERVKKGNRRVKGLGSEETGIAGLDICYWKGHTADKMVRKCKNVHKKGYVHDVKRYPVIEEAKARLRGISLAEEVVLDILAGEQGEDASRLADRIVEECRRIGIVDERFRVDSREDSQPAASAQHCLPSVMRRWMIDSGCAMDLIAEADLTQDEKDMAIEAKKVRFNTANGNTTSKQEICMDIQGMPETMRIRMLESTPAVLSMGRRCMKMGYSFHWLAGANPVFVKPDSSLIVLKVIGDIPYMVDRMSTVVSESERSDYIYPAMPAPLAIELPVRGNSSPRRIGE